MPETSYKKNFLTKVIARIDFANPIFTIAQKLPQRLTERALDNFPILEPRKTITKELKLVPVLETKDIESMQWNFYGKNREKRLTLDIKSIYVSYEKYSNFNDFRRDFLNVLELFFKEFPDAVPNRVGLRYVNTFDLTNGDPFDWGDYFNANLLCTLNFYSDKTVLARAFNVLEFNFTDFNIRFQYGMPNPDFPSPIKRKYFVLDFDSYHQGLQNLQDITKNLDVYHAKIEEMFKSCITNALREKMNA